MGINCTAMLLNAVGQVIDTGSTRYCNSGTGIVTTVTSGTTLLIHSPISTK